VLKLKKVAVIGDTTGYGTASVEAYVPMVKGKGGDVVYQGEVDASNPDLKPELLRMRTRRPGHHAMERECRFLSRILNTRGQMGWTCRSLARPRWVRQTKALLEKPEYWNKVYQNNFRPCSFTSNGKLPRARGVRRSAEKAKIEMATRCCGGSRSAMTRRG